MRSLLRKLVCGFGLLSSLFCMASDSVYEVLDLKVFDTHIPETVMMAENPHIFLMYLALSLGIKLSFKEYGDLIADYRSVARRPEIGMCYWVSRESNKDFFLRKCLLMRLFLSYKKFFNPESCSCDEIDHYESLVVFQDLGRLRQERIVAERMCVDTLIESSSVDKEKVKKILEPIFCKIEELCGKMPLLKITTAFKMLLEHLQKSVVSQSEEVAWICATLYTTEPHED